MNSLKNKVTLIGNVGDMPAMHVFEENKKILKLMLATHETFINSDGDKITETQWHRLVAFGKTADIMHKYLSKGSEIAVEGKLVNQSYINKDGEKTSIPEIQVNDFLMIGGIKG